MKTHPTTYEIKRQFVDAFAFPTQPLENVTGKNLEKVADWWLSKMQEREDELRAAVEGLDEQNHITQAILEALEYRGFYDAEKYLDGSIWERVKPLILKLLGKRADV